MVLLLVVGGVFLFRMLARPRYQASPQGAGAANGNAYRQSDAQHGGETAARPWSGAASQPAGGGSMIGSGLLGGQTWGVPEDVLDTLARGLTQKMMHGALAALNSSDAAERANTLEVVQRIFLRDNDRGR